MTPTECEFEAEVLEAAMQSRWPERADASLRAHVSTCAICADVAAVAGAIGNIHERERVAAVVPDSGRVWWLAQLRARREAAETAGRPITAAHVIAFACAAGLLGACFGATSTWFQSTIGWIGSSLAELDFTPFIPSFPMVMAAAALLCLVPAAIFLATRKDER